MLRDKTGDGSDDARAIRAGNGKRVAVYVHVSFPSD